MSHLGFQKIKIQDLQIGMHIRIPLAWYEHPFLTNQITLKSQEDITKLKELGIQEVDYHPAHAISVTPPPLSLLPAKQKVDPLIVQQEVVTKELISSIQDQKIPPVEKAKIVKAHSVTMMKHLLEHPTAENIAETKKGISAIVSLILNDNNTLHYLLEITSHDYYTYTHSVDVGVLSVALSKVLFRNSSLHDLHALGAGFFLHDLGKVKVDEAIINKPGKLTADEMVEMRRHPVLGYKLLMETNQLTEESKTIVLQHHERLDGTGYPKGLSNHQIHLYGRICAIADVYDALTTDRPYRKKMKPFEALKLMRDEMRTHFQKELFEQFVLLLNVT